MKPSSLTRSLLKMAGRKAVNYAGRKLWEKNPFNFKSKNKVRKPNSHTKSKTQKERKVRKVYVGRGEMNANSIYIDAKGKKIAKTSGTWSYQQTHAGFLTSTAGLQGNVEMCTVNTPNQCITSTGTGFSIIQNNTALEMLNPNITNTAGGVMVGPTIPVEDQFCIKKNFIDLEMTNMSGVAVYLDVYVCKTKKIHPIGPTATWNGGYSNEAFSQPSEVQPAAGGLPATLAVYTPGYMNMNVVGCNPMDSPVFRSTWRIAAKRNVLLAGGVTEKLKITIALNKVIKRDVALTYVTNATPYVPWSYTVFAVARGQVVVDRTVPANITPTYGSTDIAYIANVRTTCCAVANQQGKLSTNRSAMVVPIGASAANQSYINEETDLPQTVASSTVV